MKLPAGAGQGIGIAIAIGAGALAVWWLLSKGGKAASDAVKAVGSINEGTPYEGGGVVGTIGHATDAVSGGVLSNFGSWLGTEVFYPLFNDEYNPNETDKKESSWWGWG